MNIIALSIPWTGPAVLQQAARDTVVMVQARDPLALAESGAMIVLGLAVAAMFVLFLRVALEVRRLEEGVGRLVERMDERLDPVLERTANVAENVDYVSRVVREDVERLSRSVQRMGDRLDQASHRMEERIEEFNALMALVQAEAEDLFLDTASTVRGVREGSRAIREGDRARDQGAGADPNDGPLPSPERRTVHEGDGPATDDGPPPAPERKPVDEGELPDVEADLPHSER